MRGVLLYGPPAAGKDTITRALVQLDSRYVAFEQLKSGPGTQQGYRMTTGARLDALHQAGEVIWETQRYGARYVVDQAGMRSALGSGQTPVVHLGRAEAVASLATCQPGVTWTVAQLWCPRAVAETRLIDRGSADVAARLEAWNGAAQLTAPDVHVDTEAVDPREAAARIHRYATRGRGAGRAAPPSAVSQQTR